jgi:polyisoprenyl-teichoic acid--peptidoglycan teichoic acid transferase
MRKAKKKAQDRSRQDKEFERLYRTIPTTDSQQVNGVEDGLAGAKVPKESQEPKPRWKKILKRTLLVLATILLLVGLWLGGKFLVNSVRLFGWDGLWGYFHTTTLKGEDEGRINVLLAGNSADDSGHAGAELTDSIMLASINTKDHTGYLLSIPRDLYVDIPTFGYAKINEAYQDGERSGFSEAGYPPGGMGLLQKTVSERLGVPIHYYGLVNYAGLRKAVDAVGGVQITIHSTDPRGLYDPSPDLKNNHKPLVDLPNGTVTLDGLTALNLARARGNARGSYGYAQSDFTRTENQRNVLLGLGAKAASAGTLANPLKIGQLMDSVGGNVKTDFEPNELRRLYDLAKDTPAGRVKSASLNNANGRNLLESYRTRSGQSALIPALGVDDYSEIRAFIAGL